MDGRPNRRNKAVFSNSSVSISFVFVSDGLVWTVGLTVEIKLCFRDGLVWTVGLTEEIKLRFLDVFSVDGRPNHRNKAPFS